MVVVGEGKKKTGVSAGRYLNLPINSTQAYRYPPPRFLPGKKEKKKKKELGWWSKYIEIYYALVSIFRAEQRLFNKSAGCGMNNWNFWGRAQI